MKLFRDCRCGSSLSIRGDITGEADIPIFCNDSDNSNGHRDVVHSEITVSMCSMFSILDFKHKKSLLRSLGSPMVELSDFHSSLLWHSIDIHCSSISARKFLSGPRTTRGVLLGRHLYIPDGAVFVLAEFVLSGIDMPKDSATKYSPINPVTPSLCGITQYCPIPLLVRLSKEAITAAAHVAPAIGSP